MHADGCAGLEAVMKVVALHHAGHGVLGGQLDHAHGAQRNAPLAVVADLGFGRVQHQTGLAVVSFGVGLDLLGCQRRAGAVAPGRVADQAGEVADEKDHLMPQVLQLAHLVEHHCVADMDVRCGRVQPQFDAQGLAGGLGTAQFFHPFGLRNQLFTAAQGHGQRLLNGVGQGRSGGKRLIHKGFRYISGFSSGYNRKLAL